MKLKNKILIFFTGIILLLGFISAINYHNNSEEISYLNYELSPILDVCKRPLNYPVGSSEANKQMEEASFLYKRGVC